MRARGGGRSFDRSRCCSRKPRIGSRNAWQTGMLFSLTRVSHGFALRSAWQKAEENLYSTSLGTLCRQPIGSQCVIEAPKLVLGSAVRCHGQLLPGLTRSSLDTIDFGPLVTVRIPILSSAYLPSAQNPDPWYSAFHYSHPPLVERLQAMGAASGAKKRD